MRDNAQEVQKDALDAQEPAPASALLAAAPRGALSPLPRELSDAEVVERVCRGDVELFELLMRRYNRTVFRAARAIVRSDDEAEDVMQHAYVRAFEHIADYEGRSSFCTWVTRIAVYEALARVRRRQQWTELVDDEGPSAMVARESSPEQHAMNTELKAVIEAAIDELPTEFRIVFMLRAVEQLSVADVAECLSLPAETVKTRLFRARQRLQRLLTSEIDAATGQVFEFHLVRCDRVVAWVLGRLRWTKGGADRGAEVGENH